MFSKIVSRVRERAVLRRGVIVAFWTLLLGVALFPFLFLGRLFIDSDTTMQFYPFFFFYHEAIQNGWSFLWNPSIFLGFPTYLSQTGGFLDPLNWVLFHLPLHALDLYHVRLYIDLFLALAFSYMAGRELNRTRLASLLIGMGYIIAFNWRYLSNILIVNGLFLIPFLIYASLRLFRATKEWERWLWVLLSGAAIGWSFLSGNAQFTVEGTFLFGLFFMSYFFLVWDGQKEIIALIRWGGYGLAVLGVAFLVALPQIMPSLEFTPLTVRAGGVAYEDAIHKVTEPGDVILFTFPDYLYFPYVSGGRKPLYIGTLLFLLALVGMREVCKRNSIAPERRERNLMRIMMGLFAFSFLASLKWSPIFYIMLKLPVFELFRFPYRWMYLGIWFLCALGAYGFDVLYGNAKELRSSFLTRGVVALYGTIATWILALNILGDWFWDSVAIVFNIFFTRTLHGHGPFVKDVGHYQDAFSRGIDAWREFVSLGDISFAVPFAIFLASFMLIGLVVYEKVSRAWFRNAAFALAVVTFLTVFIVQWPYSVPRTLTHAHAQLLDSTVAPGELDVYRTFPFMLAQSLSFPPTYRLTRDQIVAIAEMQYVTGWPDMHVYDTRATSVDGYDVFVPVDYITALGAIGSTHGGQTEVVPYNENIGRLTSNLDILGMLTGKYIISGVPLSDKNLTLRATTSASHLGGEIGVYENAYALPRWYFAKKVIEKPHHSLSELLDDPSARSFMRQTYLDCLQCAVSGASSRGDSVSLTSRTFTRYEFETYAKAPQWLIFSESYLPGWELHIDGVPADITRANGMLMAAYILGGEHTVVWEYRGILGEATLFEKLHIFKKAK